MSVVNSLFQDIESHLRVKAQVVSQMGAAINVGETFVLRVTGFNAADTERVVFLNPRVNVGSTLFADPISPVTTWYTLPATRLTPGDSSFVDISFRAKAALGWNAFNPQEDVARAAIAAELDQTAFFSVIWRKWDTVFFAQIDP